MWKQQKNKIDQLEQILEKSINEPDSRAVDDWTLYKEFMDALNYINKNLLNPWTFIAVIDLDNLKILYASDTCKELFDTGGNTFQNPLDLPLSLLLSESMTLFKNAVTKFQKMIQHVPLKRRKSVKTQLVGLPIKSHNGKKWISFANIHNLTTHSDGTPSIILMMNQNIAHLYNANFIWMRQSYSQFAYCKSYYHSGLDEIFTHDIISKRELQILRFLAQGLQSHDIASELNISINTVSNHRKNMTYRVGVSDTTALLQIAQWCELI